GAKELAEDIIRTDNEIDQMEVQIEEECLKVLALHQPVASDLRLIVAIIKINNELERVGDMAVSIAKRVQIICKKGGTTFNFDYMPMAVKVLGMIKMSLDALVTENADFARRIFIDDEEVDTLRNKAYKAVVEELDADTGHAAALLNLYLLSRHLERIGDRACNIAEEVIYLVEGDIIRNE
ncbi:MAG: phosphate transport system regulatory protein PhoU, partial [Candidatus Electrothrix sp. AUS1_2]|nr:phosphate transport system regulatory protein PhoU [Candidatus Electrothrix sp. AUS1_2]